MLTFYYIVIILDFAVNQGDTYMENLTDLTFVLDEKMGGICEKVETLHDIQVTLSQLVTEMDIAAHNGEQFHLNSHNHRQFRLLKELMCYTVNELNENYQEAYTTHEKMFNEISGQHRMKKDAEKWNESARIHNTQSFIKSEGKHPKNYEEVLAWCYKKLSEAKWETKKMQLSCTNNIKKASSLGMTRPLKNN